jgi:stage II sporulation protein D
VADIELSHGRIVKIHSKNNGVTGTLASYSGEEVQLEGYESVRCDESLPVYYVTDSEKPTESVRQISLSDLVIGNSEMELIVTDGMAAAIVTYRTDEVDKIRVLLKNGNEIFYSSLYVKSNSSVSVGEEKVDAKTVISAHTYLKDSVSGKEIRITPQNGGMLFLCDKDGKKKTEGYEGDFILRKAEDGYVLINELPIETYVRYVLPSEMPTGFSYEALKAQAVCARTFAYGQMKGDTYAKYGANLDDSTAYQVYHATTSYEVTDRAVEDTQGMVLTYQNELIDCYYYSTSPGYSENLEVWGTQSPDYLVAENHTKTKTQNLSRKKIFHQFITDQVSSYDMESPYYRWSATLSGKLGMDEKYGRLKSIKINERSESGYVLSLTIVFEEGERTYDKENDIRFALGKYVSQIELADGTVRTDMHSVPSACFEVKSQKDGTIVLTGGGFGHGIGMSQYGADAMGREGKTWQEILTFYYKGASIESVQK